MKALIEDLRLMTGAGPETLDINGVKHFTDADLERKLENRVGVRYVQAPIQMFAQLEQTEGKTALVYKEGRVEVEGTLDTESAKLVNFYGAPIEGETTIHGDGRIEFTVNQLGKAPLLTGTTYDLNGAAADVLTDWASAVKLGYDITTDGQELKRSQRHAQLLEQAKAFRDRAIIGSVSMRRYDAKVRGQNRGAKALLESFDRLGLYPPSQPET